MTPPIPGIGKDAVAYCGRFAPSPSGNLHFGSLVTALASYLDARSHHGKWLLRIDDLDTPRTRQGAADQICRTLECHGLTWDEAPFYQGQQLALYDEVIQWLLLEGLAYGCCCTRKEIKQLGNQYTGTCRAKQLPATGNAVRLLNPNKVTDLSDALLGTITPPKHIVYEDFVLRRRDGIIGYHLAAVVDDIQQQITHVVRGADLLYPSVCQKVLYQLWQHPIPVFMHIPVAVSEPGKKLSKQNHSPELKHDNASENITLALDFLGHSVPDCLVGERVESILEWAVTHWQLNKLPRKREVEVQVQTDA